MHKRDWPLLVLGLLITTVGACAPVPETPNLTAEPELAATPLPTATPPPTTAAEPDRDAAPLTAAATGTTAGDWQPLGGDRTGLAVTVPAGWVNLTDRLNAPAMGNRLGINLLFAADSERTGRSLLAGKSFSDGAYITGLIVAPPAPAARVADSLVDLVTAAAPAAARLSNATPVVSANGVDGFAIDLVGGPVGLAGDVPDDLRTRLVVFAPEPAAGNDAPAWIALLLSASRTRWSATSDTFAGILASARVFDVRRGAAAQEGQVVVRGELQGERDLVSATLERQVNDLWTFTAAGNRYASLFLRPEAPQLDLTLTLLGPDRQTVARADNGFAGVTESVTDLRLGQPGVYIVEVSDFFHATGRYTLSLVLSDQPQYSGGGTIAWGEALQGELPPGGQHYWVFEGAAGQRVSVVVEPRQQSFDAILDLIGPDGAQLVSLDEGFSGDPEVLAGYALPATGQYALLVRSFSPEGGGYTISLEESAQEIANFFDAGDLAYGDVRGEALQPQEVHAWFFQGKSGDHILVRATPLSAALDLDVWLLDAAVERVAAVDDFAAGEPETLELTLARDGQYIVLVRDFNGDAGEYEIALGAAPVATPESAGAVSYGDVLMGAIPPGAAVVWTFNAEAGDLIDVTVYPSASRSDLVLQLQNPDGVTVLDLDAASAGQSEALDGFAIPADGQWRIVLREFFGEAAGYQLALDRNP